MRVKQCRRSCALGLISHKHRQSMPVQVQSLDQIHSWRPGGDEPAAGREQCGYSVEVKGKYNRRKHTGRQWRRKVIKNTVHHKTASTFFCQWTSRKETKLLMLFYCRKRAQNNISYVTVMPCSPPADFLFFTVCCVSIYTCRLLAPRRRLLPLCLCTQPVRVMDLKKKKLLGKNQCESRHKSAADTQKKHQSHEQKRETEKITQLESALTEKAEHKVWTRICIVDTHFGDYIHAHSCIMWE